MHVGPHLVERVGMKSDKRSVEDLTIRHADHNQLPDVRRACAQAVVTLQDVGTQYKTVRR